MIEATIGGITFSSDSAVPFSIESLDGWRSGAPIKTQPDDRANSDGVFGVTKFLRGARVITLVGMYIGTGEDAATYAQYDAISSLLASGTPDTLSVTDPGGTKTSEVMLFGAGSTLSELVNGMASYVIQFLAFDPVKYGPAVPYPTGLASGGGGLEYPLYSGGAGGSLYYGALGNLGRVTVVNNGTADVWPSFVVTGQLDNGFYLQCLETGDILRYDRVVPAGSTVMLDSRTGEVLIDGVSDGSTYLTSDGWFPIPRKSFATIQFNAIAGSSGAPTMTVTSSDGFW